LTVDFDRSSKMAQKLLGDNLEYGLVLSLLRGYISATFPDIHRKGRADGRRFVYCGIGVECTPVVDPLFVRASPIRPPDAASTPAALALSIAAARRSRRCAQSRAGISPPAISTIARLPKTLLLPRKAAAS
jgi:hypothetical protein